jgi:integrase
MRSQTLFDFCKGYPGKYQDGLELRVRDLDPKERHEAEAARIHRGFGELKIKELRPAHVDEWLNAHSNWNGGMRGRVQALKRAINVAVADEKIPYNPIRGYPKNDPEKRKRVLAEPFRRTYITPEQEQAMYENCSSAFRIAIRVCIRTGARPGCEFGKLTAKHITDHGDRMEWTFPEEESKTKRERVIYVMDPEILQIVRQHIKKHPRGPIFRNQRGEPWQWKTLSRAFLRLKDRLIAKGVDLDEDCCMYSCRHTYAKRCLQGYWTGQPISIETLAELMGNSPAICRKHYVRWSKAHTDHLWRAC